MLRAGPLLLLCFACGDDDARLGTDGVADARLGDAAPELDAPPAADADPRRRLSGEGLYSDFTAKTIDPDLIEFEPRFPLWSDGALKRRWIELPEGTQIDTADMDRWKFPVGTRLWKEFRTAGGALLETRLIERVGSGDDIGTDYSMGSFVWLPDESEAFLEPAGIMDVNGTAHDAPGRASCHECHRGEAGFVLGFSAVQLSKTDGVGLTLSTLASDGRLSTPPPDGTLYAPPGEEVDRAALGVLHANCGHCHNPLGSAWKYTGQILRLSPDDSERSVDGTQVYTTTVLWEDSFGYTFEYWTPPSGVTHRIVPGAAGASGIWYRMGQRDEGVDQMPPIFTDVVDDAGLGAVETWIEQL
jgi:hypothetical protein